MTTAPAALLAVRSLVLGHLGPHGLDPAEVGIVGDPAHRGGYHCGSDRVVSGDYSVVESSRDRNGLTQLASALDVGTFSYGSHNLQTFSRWLVAQCQAGAADTRDIREVIYSPDGTTVKRWDRLKKRSTGDSSHRWHTHISFHRDAIKAGRDQTPLFRRYLTTIGLIKTEDDMTPAEFVTLLDSPEVAARFRAFPWQYVGGGIPSSFSALKVFNLTYENVVESKLREEAILAKLSGASDDAVIAAIREQGEAIRAEVATHANEDAARDAELRDLLAQHSSGAIDADAFVDAVARRLGS